MPFTLIKGTFRLVNRTRTGAETGFEPDGDSIQFKPDKMSLLEALEQIGRPLASTNIGSVNLRFEGIDALELHFERSRQPLADQARDLLITRLGLDPVQYHQPRDVRVDPPAPSDGAPGYILSRTLEAHGRPVSFVFAGGTRRQDGSRFHLTAPTLRDSLNYQLLLAGHAYPLFYDLLFHDLRDALAVAAGRAQAAPRGLWSVDRSQSGFRVTGQGSLERDGVIFPKLFRRLTSYIGEGHRTLGGFLDWLKGKGEQVLDLTQGLNFTHFDNIIEVQGNRVRLLRRPDQIVFVSEK